VRQALRGETPRDLTLGDAQALLRIRRRAHRAARRRVGTGFRRASFAARCRSSARTRNSWSCVTCPWAGHFLPPGELDRDMAVCVIGSKVRSELFAHRPAVALQ